MRLADLGLAVARERERRGLSLRAAAGELGVSASTVLRLEKGEDVGGALVCRAVGWLGDGDPFAMGVRTGREMALAEAESALRGIRA